MKKKLLVAFAVLLFGIFVLGAISVSAATSGTCGANVTWTLDDEGTLTISGQGDMKSYGSSNAPWCM